MKLVAVVAVSFGVSCAVTKLLISLLRRRGVLDMPNVRSSHQVPTPRGGGIGILAGLAAGWLAGWLLEMELPRPELVAGALLVAFAGILDDFSRGFSVLARFTLQCLAAALVIHGAGGLNRLPLPDPLNIWLGSLAGPVALLWIVGATNLYNFLDGIDGFAASQGLVAGVAAVFLSPTGALTAIGLGIAGSCAAFLLYNWHPARIFMGDVGSATLGFILASLPFQLSSDLRSRAVFTSAMCLWFFLSDGAFTLVRRLAGRERVWQAHRSHLYQRLVRTGLRHDAVVLAVCGAGLLLSLIAVLSLRLNPSGLDWLVVGFALLCFLLYATWTARREAECRLVAGR